MPRVSTVRELSFHPSASICSQIPLLNATTAGCFLSTLPKPCSADTSRCEAVLFLTSGAPEMVYFCDSGYYHFRSMSELTGIDLSQLCHFPAL